MNYRLSSAHFSSPLWGEDEGEGEIKTLTLNPHPIPLPLKKGEGMTKHSEKMQNSSYRINSRMTRVLLFLIFLFSCHLAVRAQDSDVQIQKSEDRTAAIVVTKEPPRKRTDDNLIDRSLSKLESVVMGMAAPVSSWSGKTMDQVTVGFEKTGSFLFSRFFHLVDLKEKFQ
jgi:hypothetical protein